MNSYKEDISYLLEPIDLNQKVQLIITPYSPISLIAGYPSDYMHTEIKPTLFHLCGLLENCLNLHINIVQRTKIVDNIYHINKIPFEQNINGYLPIIQHHLKIENIEVPPFEKIVDYQHFQSYRNDEGAVNGFKNVSLDILNNSKSYKDLETEYKKNKGILFPIYYRKPKKREWIWTNYEPFIIDLLMTKSLYEKLNLNIGNKNTYYLGNNDSIVDLQLIQLNND